MTPDRILDTINFMALLLLPGLILFMVLTWPRN